MELVFCVAFFSCVWQQAHDPVEVLHASRSAPPFLSCTHGLSPRLCGDSEMEEAGG